MSGQCVRTIIVATPFSRLRQDSSATEPFHRPDREQPTDAADTCPTPLASKLIAA
jgi:hypothetical protein